jgi:hypothetical protein
VYSVFLDQGNPAVLELYDLSADPYEEHDLAGQRKYELKIAELKSWVAEIALQMVNRPKILSREWQQAHFFVSFLI